MNLSTLGADAGEQLPHLGIELRLVHGGQQSGARNGVQLIPWDAVQSVAW